MEWFGKASRRFAAIVIPVLLVGCVSAAPSAPPGPGPSAAAVGGPLVLLGIDGEDCGPGGHGPIDNYIQLVESVRADVTNGGTGGILVLGGPDGPASCQGAFWDAIGTALGETVTHAEGAAAITSQSFAGFEIIAVAGSSLNTFAGTDQAEADALAARQADVAAFINGGGGLIGFDQTGLANPFDYVAAVGSVATTDTDFSDIDPTPSGTAVGVDNNLDVSFWHQYFTQYPSFLTVLAFVAGTQNVAALGGESVTVSPEDCADGIDNDGDGLVDGADPDCQTTPPGNTCNGLAATIVGTPFNDDGKSRPNLAGTPGRDVIVGLGGNDWIKGFGDNDVLCGNEGVDTIQGFAGNDFIDGGPGKDRLSGGDGDDEVHGRGSADLVKGENNNDSLFGEAGNDTVDGGPGTDACNGGAGADAVRGCP
jgi:Ca2+-binding RTX toxin-like protein